MSQILVTGAAGFIGFHTAQSLLKSGHEVVGIDNLNDYYSPQLKRDRLGQIDSSAFTFVEGDFADRATVERLFTDHRIDQVIHLGAQAGVRYSLENPHAYVQSNLVGFCNILEACRHGQVKHLVYASSSSVYGLNSKMPLSTSDPVDHPVSLYAATKKSNELMAHTYSYLYGLPTTGLRFFTVYGPWGRPDMSPFLFANAMVKGEPIQVFNHGQMKRDFTYIDDIVEGVVRVLKEPPIAHPGELSKLDFPNTSTAPYRIFNIGNNQPVALLDYIHAMEVAFGIEAKMEFLPMQPGDVLETYADVDDLAKLVGFRPKTPLAEGLASFATWFKRYYGSQ